MGNKYAYILYYNNNGQFAIYYCNDDERSVKQTIKYLTTDHEFTFFGFVNEDVYTSWARLGREAQSRWARPLDAI